MRIKRFVAPDMRTALRMVRDEHGPDAVILSNRSVHGGIEVVAATDYDEALVQQALRTAAAEPAPAAPEPAATPAQARAANPEPSRADAMIAALAGAAEPVRQSVAERARAVSRLDAATPKAPALSSLLRKAVPAPAPAAEPPADASLAGDDFRALLARLNDGDEPAPVISPQGSRLAGHAQGAPMATDAANDAPGACAADPVQPPATSPAVASAAVPAVAPAEPVAHEAVLPTFAELATVTPAPTPAPMAAAPAPALVDAMDPLAEMAAAQAPLRATVAAPAAVAAPPTLQVVVSQSEDPTIVAMRNELASMRQMIERQMGQFAIERLRGSPARALAFETLQAYGCDDSLAQTIAGRIDPRLEPAKVKAPLLAELARMLTIAREEPLEDGGVFALIGPTGAGKTTTLAKLAARFAQRHRARDVALVTTDVERPGAREQLHALGRRLGITVCEAEGPEGLTDALDQLVDYPLVLVDTAGYAARDRALLGQVTWLRATRGLRSLLVLPANLQPHDMAETVRRYRMAQPEAVVLTKLDETGRLGGALSVAVKHGLSIAYTTAGQQVPADLEAADASRLVLALEKLRRAADNPLATEERHVVA